MNEEIEAMLGTEYDDEVDVEREIRRLRQTNEHLPSDPEEDQRIRDIVEAVDAEIEADDAQALVPRERFIRLSPSRRDELAAGRHLVIAAYSKAELATSAASDANAEMWAAYRRAHRSLQKTPAKKLQPAYLPLRYLVAEVVLGVVLVAAVVMNLLITSQHLGFNTGTLGTIAATIGFIAVIADRGLRRRVVTLERHRTAKKAEAHEAAAREALLQLELHWSDLRASAGEAIDDVIEQGSPGHQPLEAPIRTTEDVLGRYTSNTLTMILNETVQLRREKIWQEADDQDIGQDLEKESGSISVSPSEINGRSAE